MDNILLILAELAVAICLFYSCRCYVKHFNVMRQTSRRSFSYILFAAATALSLFVMKDAPLALVCNGVLICYFSFYIGFKVRKHVRNSSDRCDLSEATHSVVAKNYRNWYCIMFLLLLALVVVAIVHY